MSTPPEPAPASPAEPPAEPAAEPPAEPAAEPWGALVHLAVERSPQNLHGVVLVTLDLADRRNAMSEEMTQGWRRVMRALGEDPSVRAVVVTGRGRAFCAGGDLSWLGATPDADVAALRSRMLDFYRAWLTVADLPVPTIAAINGSAIGAGLTMALACDIRVAATDARLAVPFTSLGLHPGMATTWLLRRAAGDTMARDMLLTGRALSGADAAACGLVSRSVPREDVLSAALAIAAAVSTTAPVAAELTKAALAPGGPSSFEAALSWEGLAQPVTLATADVQEGLAAAREKRPPRFRGQ